MLLYGNLANPSSLFAYVKAGATTACVSMYVFWTHACVLIPKTRFPSNHVSKTLYPKTERILQVRACRNFRGSFEHRNCAIVHVHLELRLQHWKIFGYVTTPYPTAYIYAPGHDAIAYSKKNLLFRATRNLGHGNERHSHSFLERKKKTFN